MSARTALIADDDEFFRLALASLLRSKLGFKQVIETASLDEAIERLSEAGDISVALFDLSMPGMQSPASLRAVRENFPDLRVAVVSASEEKEDIFLALRAGVHGYVPKGVGVAELPRALQIILEGSIYVPPSLASLPSPEEELKEGAAPGQSPRPAKDILTPRQWDCLELIVQGRSNKEIARTLKLGEGTVKVHVAALFRSLGVSSRSGVAAAGAKLLTAQ